MRDPWNNHSNAAPSIIHNVSGCWRFGGSTLFRDVDFSNSIERNGLASRLWKGAALLWLFHRIPHPGLRLVGAALLCVAFARLR